MKKIIIVLGIILTSGIAALALSIDKQTDVKTAQVKIDKNDLISSKAPAYGNVKNNIASAD